MKTEKVMKRMREIQSIMALDDLMVGEIKTEAESHPENSTKLLKQVNDIETRMLSLGVELSTMQVDFDSDLSEDEELEKQAVIAYKDSLQQAIELMVPKVKDLGTTLKFLCKSYLKPVEEMPQSTQVPQRQFKSQLGQIIKQTPDQLVTPATPGELSPDDANKRKILRSFLVFAAKKCRENNQLLKPENFSQLVISFKEDLTTRQAEITTLEKGATSGSSYNKLDKMNELKKDLLTLRQTAEDMPTLAEVESAETNHLFNGVKAHIDKLVARESTVEGIIDDFMINDQDTTKLTTKGA
jgi:hypothetical protein